MATVKDGIRYDLIRGAIHFSTKRKVPSGAMTTRDFFVEVELYSHFKSRLYSTLIVPLGT